MAQSAAPRKLDPLAAFLSYLVPGLGQVIQGRIGKGFLFFVCLYGMFFYGMWLGQWKNVWLADARALPEKRVPRMNIELQGFTKDLAYRTEFMGQFWMGAVVWPALVQYMTTPVIDDRPELAENRQVPPNRVFGSYMQAPSESELNELQRNSDKRRWDLGWVYTVIAGVLNILVIYDAFAGPIVKDEEQPEGSAAPAASTGGAA